MSERKTLKMIQAIVRNHLPDKNYRVFLFGSRAEGTNRKFSDYDIGIMGKKPVDRLAISYIKEDLENSNIPYNIDVVDFKIVDKDFKHIAMQNVQFIL